MHGPALKGAGRLLQKYDNKKGAPGAMICNLCPRRCGALRDEAHGEGFCKMPDLPVCARAALHPWEEPCISGKAGAGTVFFSGCTLGCVFCQNAPISRGKFGKPTTEDELYAVFQRLAKEGASCIELVTPTQFSHVLARVLERPAPGGLPVVWNSGGYERVETLLALKDKVDIYLPDLKYLTPGLAEKYSGAGDYPEAAKAAISEMYRQRGPARLEDGMLKSGVLIRHLILPGHTKNSMAVLERIARDFPGVPVSLMAQYTPWGQAREPEGIPGYPELSRPITRRELHKVQEALFSLNLGGFVQSRKAMGGDFIPAWDMEEPLSEA